MLDIFGILDKFSIVKQLPLFSELNFFEKSLIAKKCELEVFKTADIIYREGDVPDAFYCLVSGRVKLFVKSKEGREQTLEYLSRGKYFGIISLLTGEPHSVTVEVINDSVVLKIKKEDFDYILQRIPKLAIDLSQSLSRRLKRKDLHQKTVFESTVISVYSPVKGIGKTLYALNLAISLHQETLKRAIFLQIGQKFKEVLRALSIDSARTIDIKEIGFNLPRLQDSIIGHKTGIDFLGVAYSNGSDAYISAVISILSHLTNDYHYIIIDLPAELDPTVFKTLTQSDLIHLVTDTEEGNLNIIAKLMVDLRTSLKHAEPKIKIIANELKKGDAVAVEKRAQILKHEIWANLPFIVDKGQLAVQEMLLVADQPASEYARAIRRIARQIGQVMVGLALGCGAASGLAHLGVIKVLERENIPIDIVSGSSIGAMIGAFWASGLSAQQIEEAIIKNRVKLSGYNITDFIFPKLGLMRPKRIEWFLKEVMGDKTFYDIRFPLKIMSTDVRTREEVAIEDGSLAKAVLASSAIPGIFEPVRYGDRYLMDGGVLNPVPVGILMKLGIKKIIAINVLPYFDAHYAEKAGDSQVNKKISKYEWFKKRIRPWLSPNIVDVIMSSLQAMEYVLAEASCQQADIFIRPDIEPSEWFNFLDAQHFIKKGEEAAEKYIAEIKKLIKE